jgi:hypothetical protein
VGVGGNEYEKEVRYSKQVLELVQRVDCFTIMNTCSTLY